MIKNHLPICKRGVRLNLTLPGNSIAGCGESATPQLSVSSKIRRFSDCETPKSVVRWPFGTRITAFGGFGEQFQGALNLAKPGLIFLQPAKMNHQGSIQAVNIVLQMRHGGFDFFKAGFQRTGVGLRHDKDFHFWEDQEQPASTTEEARNNFRS